MGAKLFHRLVPLALLAVVALPWVSGQVLASTSSASISSV